MGTSKKKKGQTSSWNDTINSALTGWFALFDDDESSTSTGTTISYYNDVLSCHSGSTTGTTYSTGTYDTHDTTEAASFTRTKAKESYKHVKEKQKKEAQNSKRRYKQLLLAQSRDDDNDEDSEDSFLECNVNAMTCSKEFAANDDKSRISNASSTTRSISSQVVSFPKIERQRLVKGTPLVNRIETNKVYTPKSRDDDQKTTIHNEIDIDTSHTQKERQKVNTRKPKEDDTEVIIQEENDVAITSQKKTQVFERPKGILNKTQSTIQESSKLDVDTLNITKKKDDGILRNRSSNGIIKVKKQVSFSFDNEHNLNNHSMSNRKVYVHAASEDETFISDPILQALAMTSLS